MIEAPPSPGTGKRWRPRGWPLAGVAFGLLTLLLNTLAHYHPVPVEQWYSRGLFLWIRRIFDATTGQLPFPAFYLFWLAVVVFWVQVYRLRPAPVTRFQAFRYWVGHLAGFSGVVFGLFFWLWGFHYARQPFQVQMGWELRPLDSVTLWRELESETKILDSLRYKLAGTDSTALNAVRFVPVHAEDTVRHAVEKWLAEAGFPIDGRVRGRLLPPAGILFKFGASGIYWPFVGEGNIDAGLHPLRQMPAMAHEMSHGYGFSDEGVCNFIAYAALADHPDTWLAYCARLDYWTTLAHACRKSDVQRFDLQFVPTLWPGIIADQKAIREQHRRYRELAPQLRYQVYDSYLKAQGIASGMLNYNEVLMLVRAWREGR